MAGAELAKMKMGDNWAGRSKGAICERCISFTPKKVASGKSFGRCRKHAPTLQGWPAVWGTDWCGDHKLNEEVL